jgi:superoxide reductase
MTEKKQIYRCNICGNMVEVLHIGTGKLTCCENPMELLIEREDGTGPEKHLPVIEETDNGVKIKVGSTPHPMEDNHCIEWVEMIANNKVYRKVLKPGDKPEADFDVKITDISQIQLREYCSIHGLWKS